ncbi:MAG TPA: hypothetical protein VGG38_14945 [Acidimicrobiales bacterium]
MATAAVVGSWTAAGAAGILPPNNPSSNIAPSSSDFLTAIDSARAQEGVGPMAIDEQTFDQLPFVEQMLAVINLERIDRGLQPIEYVTTQLDNDAAVGANEGTDPGFPTDLTNGAPVTFGGSIWAGGLTSVLEADYYWMYDDGYGGLLGETSNAGCGLLSLSECWGHRDIILHTFPNCGSSAPTLSLGADFSSTGYEGGSMAAVLISTCGGAPDDVIATWSSVETEAVNTTRTVGIAATPDGNGYWEAESDGQVANFGDAGDYGSMSGQTLNSPIVGIAATPDGGGYWLAAADGGIFSFGDALFYGSTGALHLNSPIVGIASTPNGRGYWMVAADGGIFSFGDALFQGSMGGHRLNQPVVGMASDPTTGGYWLVAADGGIFSFGAPFFGSTGALHLNKPIVGIEALANGLGYRFEASDGGVFDFGKATFDGSMGGTSLVAPVVGMASDNPTNGYWLAAEDGGIFSFGGASFLGRVVNALTSLLF